MMPSHRRARAFTRNILLAGAAAAFLANAPVAVLAADTPQRRENTVIEVDLPAGDLENMLVQLGRQANVQIAFQSELVHGTRAGDIRGKYTVEQAITRLLRGTGLHYKSTSPGAYVITGTRKAAAEEGAVQDAIAAKEAEAEERALPELLVKSHRLTLNLDNPHTQDDPQPYVIISRDELLRSGATGLEDFFRDYLGSDTTAAISTQGGGLNGAGQSRISLRGLGTSNTLILVDGRRLAQANLDGGAFDQASVNGIPIDAIERIEVLASSASGIYGSAAVGGVVNIILRRDFKGVEASLYYGNTSRLDDYTERATLNGTFPIGSKTSVTFLGSADRTQGLQEGQRNFIADGRALLAANQPAYLNTIPTPVDGATPNIISSNGRNLVLKPQYGGTSLGSNITYVPAGYAGVAQSGVAALIANAGKQNLALGQNAASLGFFGDGALAPLLTPTKSYNGSLSVRHDATDWLSLYGEIGYSRHENDVSVSQGAAAYTIPASATNNPFTSSISVFDPVPARNVDETSASINERVIGGAIVSLPFGWKVALDTSFNWNSFEGPNGLPAFDAATIQGINTGTINLLRDLNQYPVSFGYSNAPSGGTLGTPTSRSNSYVVKFAGPISPLELWGGKPVATVQLQRDEQFLGNFVSYTNGQVSSVNFSPPRSQDTNSVYAEVRFPIIGAANEVPLVRELELVAAGRDDIYHGVGALTDITCFPSNGQSFFIGPLPASAYGTPCPAPGQPVTFASTNNHSANPLFSVRWALTQDVALRGSYSTGYVPPFLNAVVAAPAGIPGTFLAGKASVNVTDPLRGHEPIGQPLFPGLPFGNILSALTGGNPNVAPQTSQSISFGTILTPRSVPGLRLSADWTRITIDNAYFQPFSLLLNGNQPAGQQAFESFLAAFPGRFTRSTDPATFGAYKVGPITFADVTTANFTKQTSESFDFAGSYDTELKGGNLNFQGTATYLKSLLLQATPASAPVDSAGAIGQATFGSGAGGTAWKANGSVVYSRAAWTAGVRGRYFGPYFLNIDHSVNLIQGSAAIDAQYFVDVFGSYKFPSKTELFAGVNNVFDRAPAVNVSNFQFYSYYGDPLGANFYVRITQRF